MVQSTHLFLPLGKRINLIVKGKEVRSDYKTISPCVTLKLGVSIKEVYNLFFKCLFIWFSFLSFRRITLYIDVYIKER